MSKTIRILIAGDVVGSPGRSLFSRIATRMKSEGRVDAIVVNAENAAAGRGISAALAEELLAAGADVITLGDHTWDQKDLPAFLAKSDRIIRPANFPPDVPGRGWTTVNTQAGQITVINLVGRVFMQPHYDCPFRAAGSILDQTTGLAPVRIVDMHAEATSEKIAMGRYLEGRVSAVVGTHTHVQTSDDTILSAGTAYITDLGMTGPKDSVLGREVEPVLSRFLNGRPTKFGIAKNQICLEGVLLEADPATGKAVSFKRLRLTEND